MTDAAAVGDEGGEAACFAHLLDSPVVTDALLASAVRELSDAVVIAGADGTIVFWNDAAGRLFGWSASEAVGRSVDLIIPQQHRDPHWAGYHRAMATGQTNYGERPL